MDAAPKVTVVLRVRDGAAYLEETLQALDAQTFRDFEVVAVEDGSTDATPSILAAREGPRFRVVRESGRGPENAFNVAARAARGEYLAVVDHDDPPMPERFERQVRFLDANPRVAVLGTGALFVDERTGEREEKSYATDDATLREVLGYYNPFVFPSVLLRRDAVLAVGGQDTARKGADYHLILRLAREHEVATLADILVVHRLHASMYTLRTAEERLRFQAEHRFLAVRTLRPSLKGYAYASLFWLYTKLPAPLRRRLPRGALRALHALFDRSVRRRRLADARG